MKRNLFTIATIVSVIFLFVAVPAMAAEINLTSLGKTADGKTVWRIQNTTDSDQVVRLESVGNGTVGYFGLAAGEHRTVYSPHSSGAATHKVYSIYGDTVKAAGPQLYEPSIENIAFKNGVPVQEAERLLANGVLSNQAKNDEQDGRLDGVESVNNIQQTQINHNTSQADSNTGRLNSVEQQADFNTAGLIVNSAVTAINHAEIYNTQDLNGDGLTDGDMNHVNGSQWPYSEIPVEEEPPVDGPIQPMATPMNGAPMPPGGLYPPGTYYDNPEVPPTFEIRNWVSCFESGDCDLSDHPLLQEPGPSRIDLNEAKNVEQDERLDENDVTDNRQDGELISIRADQQAFAAAQADVDASQDERIFNLEKATSKIMDDLERNEAGIAAAVATASLQFDPGMPGLQMAVGAGTYRGETAGSLGIGGKVGKKLFLNANAGYTSEYDYTVGAGMTIMFGGK